MCGFKNYHYDAFILNLADQAVVAHAVAPQTFAIAVQRLAR